MNNKPKPSEHSSNVSPRLVLIEKMVMESYQLQGKPLIDLEQISSMARTWDELMLLNIPTERLRECWQNAVQNHDDWRYPLTPREIVNAWQSLAQQMRNESLREQLSHDDEDFVSPEELRELLADARKMLRRL